MREKVLVLNQNYDPLNVCSVRRAMGLIFKGKAEVLVENHRLIHTVSVSYECPSVIRLYYLVRRPLPQVRLTRREIFRRDEYTCQYCGQPGGHLTLDHVVPRHRGGKHTWDNLVTACIRCNRRKGGRTLEEAGMRLLQLPAAPKASPYYYLERRMEGAPEEWTPFLPVHLRSN